MREKRKAKSENTQKEVNKVLADEGSKNRTNDFGDTHDEDQDKEEALKDKEQKIKRGKTEMQYF
jgi:hypothetical protein